MRLTLKEYEQAKKAVERAKAHQKVMKKWDEALKKAGNLGDQKVVAMRLDDETGELLKMECEPDETAGKPILKAG